MIPNRSAYQSSQPANTYTYLELDTLAEQAIYATMQDLGVAAELLQRLLDRHQIQFALMGGFSLAIRGSGRDTHDVDIAVGCTKLQLIEALSSHWRFRRPSSPTGDVTRIFINIADNESAAPVLVSADLIMRGTMGLPDRLVSEDLEVETSQGQKLYRVLDLRTLLSTKLLALFVRGSATDRDDIAFIAQTYASDVWEISASLDAAHRQNFMNRLRQTRLPAGTINRIKQALRTV